MKKLAFLALISLTLFSCQKKIIFKQGNKYINPPEIEEDNKEKIEAAQKIISIFVDVYQSEVKGQYNINPLFFDSLSLMKNENISANYYLSTFAGSVIEIYYDTSNTFSIYGSDLPAETMFFDSVNFYSKQDIFSQYRKYKGQLDLSGIGNIALEGQSIGDSIATTFAVSNVVVGKLYETNKETFVYLNNLKYDISYGTHKKIVYSKHKGVTILTGNNNVSDYVSNAIFLGSMFADTEVQNLYFKSEYYREILAEIKLRPLALEILGKKDRAAHDNTYHYGSVEFLLDRQRLQKEIDSFDIKLKPDSLFSDARIQMRTGSFLWYYANYLEYSIQWLVADGAYVLFVFALLYFNILTKLKKPWDAISIYGLFVALNWYCFDHKPADMPFYYWCPALTIFAVYYLLFYYNAKTKTP